MSVLVKCKSVGAVPAIERWSVMQQQPIDYETPQTPATSSSGCLMQVIAGLWVLAITITVPISADRYHAPMWVKYLVTGGHLAAVVIMSLPYRGKTRGATTVATLVSLWALMQVAVMWFWN